MINRDHERDNGNDGDINYKDTDIMLVVFKKVHLVT